MSKTFDIAKHAGTGVDELDAGSKMPQLRIIQDMSPQKNKNKEEYVEGCDTGDIIFTVTDEILPSPVTIIPIRVKSLYVEWTPRSEGGGLVAIHDLSITTHPSYEKGRKDKPKYAEWLGSNELHMTHYWFFLAKINDEWVETMIPMAKSQLKTSRALQGAIQKFRYTEKYKVIAPPLFARTFELTSEYEENANGEGYYNWRIGNPTVLDFAADVATLERAAKAVDDAKASLPSPDAPKPQPALAGDVADEDSPY